eukprot:5452563-Amphidinium_carterae.1
MALNKSQVAHRCYESVYLSSLDGRCIGQSLKYITCIQLLKYAFISTSSCIVAGLLTSFGLDLLAGWLSGPE